VGKIIRFVKHYFFSLQYEFWTTKISCQDLFRFFARFVEILPTVGITEMGETATKYRLFRAIFYALNR